MRQVPNLRTPTLLASKGSQRSTLLQVRKSGLSSFGNCSRTLVSAITRGRRPSRYSATSLLYSKSTLTLQRMPFTEPLHLCSQLALVCSQLAPERKGSNEMLRYRAAPFLLTSPSERVGVSDPDKG